LPERPLDNLPAALTTFVGRSGEYTQLLSRLAGPGCRLVTITGVGGVGKTRLALEVAHGLAHSAQPASPFSHGVYLVPLGGLTARAPLDEALATAVAGALGMTFSGPDSPVTQLLQYLHEKALLLVLDGFEHVVAGARFLTALLQDAPYLTILVTSRERLNLRGEWVIELPGLPVPAPDQPPPGPESEPDSAVQLFVQTAQALDPDFALSAENRSAIIRICRLVEGLPLGIELAASWIRMLSCAEIADEITQDLDFLTSTSQDLPIRQQGLRAVFHHSWMLLTPDEQQVLRRLAVFRGSFTREAAAAVAGAGLPQLAALIDKSLVHRVAASGSRAGVRYQVLEVLRQYAAEQLEQAGETAQTAARHADYYITYLADRTAELRGAGQLAALAALDQEIEQIRVAWRWAITAAERGDDSPREHRADAAGGRLSRPVQGRRHSGHAAAPGGDWAAVGRAGPGLFHFYDMRSWFGEGAAAFTAAAKALAADAQDPQVAPIYGMVLARQGWFTFHLGRQAQAKQLLEQSLDILRPLGPGPDQVFALNYLAATCSYLGEYGPARAHGEAALVMAQAIGDGYGQAIACNILGQTAYECADYPAAQSWSQKSYLIEQELGNRWSMAFSLTNLGKVAFILGEYHSARWFFIQSLETRQEMGDTRGDAICFNRLGDVAVALGNYPEAQERYDQSMALFREIGNQWGLAEALINRGRLAATIGDDAAAVRSFQEAVQLALNTRSVPQVRAILAATAPLARRQRQTTWAEELDQLAAAPPESLDAYRRAATHLLGWYPDAAPTGNGATPSEPGAGTTAGSGAVAVMPPGTAGAAGHTTYPAGLTAREAEVLRLVAQGLTDAQVAEKLIVSRRTVSTHLTAIYGKLGVNTRSAATRFAMENGLA
jgi:predicted ATPase/DNA-binding CsgD family transcriptional regulator